MASGDAADPSYEYSRTLDKLGKIKDTLDASSTAELDLPMLVVVGDQTSARAPTRASRIIVAGRQTTPRILVRAQRCSQS